MGVAEIVVSQDASSDMTELNFRALFESGPSRCVVLALDCTVVAVSDAYLAATMSRRDDLLYRPFAEVFPHGVGADEPAEAVRSSLQQVLNDKRPHQMNVLKCAVPRPALLGGGVEDRFWLPTNAPVLGHDGEVMQIVHHLEDVTELMQLRRERRLHQRDLGELAMRSERYVQLLDSAPDATVIIGQDGHIQMVSVQAEKLFGYDRTELVGQPLSLLIPERFRPTHQGHVSRFFASPSARPMGRALELYGRRKDGSEIPIEVSLSPQMSGGVVWVSAAIRDVSERKYLEAAARLTADRLASAVEAIQDAFALFDSDDRLILCNSMYRALLHDAPGGALVGRPYAELLDTWLHKVAFEDDAARAAFRAERMRRRRAMQTSTFDVRLRDGRKLRISDRRTPEQGIVTTIWDLTEDERQAEELRDARAAAEAASAAKSEFLSSMSHELRTPLNAILGFAQLVLRDRREAVSERHKERVHQILHGGEHLLRLIDDVLDLARIEAGRISICAEAVDVLAVMREVLTTLEPIAARHQVEITYELACSATPIIWADRTRFTQTLMNFGSNAVKYNRPNGKVIFTISCPERARVRVTVCDTGVGIPTDKQAKIMQPFQRAGQETGPIEGTGIGLVITKRLAELMQGAIGFHSTPGVGSEFWIDMPIAASGAAPEVTASASKPQAETLDGSDDRLVLYVEDNPANVAFMRDLMDSFEHVELLTVPTAEMGIELAHARKPELIIMDLNLPRMSGVEAVRILQSDDETRHIPIIALTAAASERDRERGLEAGFYRYLTKPLKVDELIQACESVLQPAPSVEA